MCDENKKIARESYPQKLLNTELVVYISYRQSHGYRVDQ